VSFTADDALAIAQAIGNAAIAINPAVAGAVTLATGLAALVKDTILPAVQHLKAHEISVVEQAALQAASAAERIRVGAPAADSN
jgi:hypothetical protein